MRALKTALAVPAATVAVLVLPGAASAEYLVPPGNSAATQYTESLPTAGGHSDTEKPSRHEERNPTKVLGAHNTEQLDAQGSAGREAAEFAAETAPSQAVAPTSSGQTESPGHGGGGGGKGGEKHRAEESQATGGAGHSDSGPGGSSGLGQILSQATGSSSGQLGLLLPLAILAAAAWAVAFLVRQRNRPTP